MQTAKAFFKAFCFCAHVAFVTANFFYMLLVCVTKDNIRSVVSSFLKKNLGALCLFQANWVE